MTQITPENTLHYLLHHTGEYGVAHCLDFDLVATADEGIEEAIRRLDVLVRCHFKFPMEGESAKSPHEFWDRFNSDRPVGEKLLDLGPPGIEWIQHELLTNFPVDARQAA